MIDNFDFCKLKIRKASEDDAELIYNFILEMAEYEHERDAVKTSIEAVKDTICGGRYAESIITEYDGEPISYAVYFYSYSTYEGKPSLYLEDLYIKEDYRGHGIGKYIFMYLAKFALDRGCSRFDWSCLDWNTKSIDFYMKLGAERQSERTIYRLDINSMKKLIEER